MRSMHEGKHGAKGHYGRFLAMQQAEIQLMKSKLDRGG